MKLEFNNINEVIDFLKEIGYNVEKQYFTMPKEDNKEEDNKQVDEWWKKNYQPYPFSTPSYPYPPLTYYNAQIDPNLSEKFKLCQNGKI